MSSVPRIISTPDNEDPLTRSYKLSHCFLLLGYISNVWNRALKKCLTGRGSGEAVAKRVETEKKEKENHMSLKGNGDSKMKTRNKC